MGDLVLSCSSPQSRNFALGIALGRGEQPNRDKLAEGAFTAPVLIELAASQNVDMPVSKAVAAIPDRQTIDGDRGLLIAAVQQRNEQQIPLPNNLRPPILPQSTHAKSPTIPAPHHHPNHTHDTDAEPCWMPNILTDPTLQIEPSNARSNPPKRLLILVRTTLKVNAR